jgi:hypothetical protein
LGVADEIPLGGLFFCSFCKEALKLLVIELCPGYFEEFVRGFDIMELRGYGSYSNRIFGGDVE